MADGLLFSFTKIQPEICTLFSALSPALLPLLPPLLISQTVLLGNRLRFMLPTLDLIFPFFSQRPSRATGYLSELRRATFPEEFQSPFCFPFSSTEFLAAASNLSSSTATGPDKVVYSMLKHLPRSGMDFLLHIFNLSWSLHSFLSIWKTSSIFPIHKMGKSFNSPSFRSISFTSCILKLFEHIIVSRLLIFLESNSILSPRQAGFRPGRSTLDQILFLSQSILDGFNKPRTGSRTILSTIDFSKAFGSAWHPTLFHKLISAGLPPCFARWTQSFLSDRCACVVY